MTLAVLSFATLLALAPSLAGAQPATPSALACETRDTTYDSRDVTCAVGGANAKGPVLFKADFSGGHDDTQASMVVSIDGLPAVCEGGGKLRLIGEDGNVHLACRVVGPVDHATTLRATIKWSHAEFVGAALTPD